MKIIASITGLAVALALPISALAAASTSASSLPPTVKSALTINNNTSHDITSIIDGKCSNQLPGNIGITPKFSQSIIPALAVWGACFSSLTKTGTKCQAIVYPNNSCSGEAVAVVTLDTQTGIEGIEMKNKDNPDNHDLVTGSGFYVTVS